VSSSSNITLMKAIDSRKPAKGLVVVYPVVIWPSMRCGFLPFRLKG